METKEVVVLCALSFYFGRRASIRYANQRIAKHNKEVQIHSDVVKMAHLAMQEFIDALLDPCSNKEEAFARYNEKIKFANIIQQGVVRR